MRRVVIGSLLVSQTLVLASIFGLGLKSADSVLTGSPLAPSHLLPFAGARIAHDLHNEAMRLALHAGFIKSEVRRVAMRAQGRLPEVVATRTHVAPTASPTGTAAG